MTESVSIEKEAIFIITDLHFYHSLANRYDYFAENLSIIERIKRIVTRYRQEGFTKITCILGGDVAHRGSANDLLNDKATQLTRYILSLFDQNFANLGNHEFTYFKNNPLWKFIKEIEDDRIKSRYPHIKGTSLIEELRVIPRLEYEDFEINFCHFSMIPTKGDKEKSILVMHDKLLSDAAYTKMNSLAKGYRVMRSLVQEDMFDYVFCGDQHMSYEKWNLGKTLVYNLSTLGRTNVLEIDDGFRERLIPVILVENGKFAGIEDELIILHKREDIVDEEKVAVSQAKYQEVKARKEALDAMGYAMSDSPIESLVQDLKNSEQTTLLQVLEQIVSGKLVEYKRSLY